MYIRNTSALLIAVVCLMATVVYSAEDCYKPLNNGALEDYHVQGTYFPSPYACNPSSDNVAFAAPSTYTFTIGDGPSCGEIISMQEVSFGYFECKMIPAGIAGTVTTCMVASSVKSNYEAVYMKFIGNDTERVFTGYFSNGRSYPTGPVLLNFDATNKEHKYGFEWTSGYIRWYVDGKEVSSALGGKALPSTPNRFYASLLTERTGVTTDDSIIPTDSTVGRNYVSLDKAPKAIFSNISYTPVVFVACDKDTGILPGDNGWAPYDPTECEQRERLVIYDEELAEGWTNTDSTESTFEDTAGPVRMGAHSISWYFTPMTARLYFINPDNFESSDYDNFQFWINGNGRFGQQIGIKMIFSDGSTSLEIKINDVLDEGVQPYDWSRAVVPFSLFGVTTNPRSVRGFVLSSISTEYGGRVVIDDVSLGYTLPMCASKTKNIYADGLAKGYDDDMSWGKWEIKSNKLARSSSYSIQWNLYENGGLRISGSSVSTKEYPGIAFWVNAAELQGQDWTVSVTSPDSTGENNVAGIPLNLFKYYGGPLPQQSDQWTRVVLPFYTFGLEETTRINGILFKTGDTYQGSLYIDDIDFISPEGSSAAFLSVGLFGVIAALAVLLM